MIKEENIGLVLNHHPLLHWVQIRQVIAES